MTSPAMREWLQTYDKIFGELQEATVAAAQAAHAAGRALEAGLNGEAQAALDRDAEFVRRCLTVVDRASALPPIPDPGTQQHFGAALALWREGLQRELDAVQMRNAGALMDAGFTREQGNAELLQAAIALLRATAQA